MKKETTRTQYESPEIYDHGNVNEITLNGMVSNADNPGEVPDSAYPPSSSS